MEMQQHTSGTLGTGEYQLMMEELNRDCTPSTFGFGKSLDRTKDIPSIILKTPLENREKYVSGDIESVWGILQDHGRIDAIYLDMEFKGVNKIRICFDETMFGELLMDWFRLLIQSQGFLMLHDSLELGEVEAIGVTGVPLDIPTTIVRLCKVKKVRQECAGH